MSRILQSQTGAILPLAIIASILGIAIVVPTAVLVGTAALRQGDFEDKTRDFYLVESAVLAVVSDLQRGADASPAAPIDYIPPTVKFDESVPNISIFSLEDVRLNALAALGQDRAASISDTIREIKFVTAGVPTVLAGGNPLGGETELEHDDNSYFILTSQGDPQSLSFEVTSETLGFPKVHSGRFSLDTRTGDDDDDDGNIRLDVFVFNPNDAAHINSGYNTVPDLTTSPGDDDDDGDDDDGGSNPSAFISSNDIDFLNSLTTKALKLKVVATKAQSDYDDDDGIPWFTLKTDQVVFDLIGDSTVGQAPPAADPVISKGTLVSGSGADLLKNDISHITVASVAQSPNSNKHIIEFEVTSADLGLTDLDEVSVPFVFQGDNGKIKLKMFVFNPVDPAHNTGGVSGGDDDDDDDDGPVGGADGYSNAPDLSTKVRKKDTDRSVSFFLSESDVDYVNSLSPPTVKIKVEATLAGGDDDDDDNGPPGPFQLSADFLAFVGARDVPTATLARQAAQDYVDPGLRDPALATMQPGRGYLFRMNNLHAGMLNINWAFDPATPTSGGDDDDDDGGEPSIQVFRGFVLQPLSGGDDDDGDGDDDDDGPSGYKVVEPGGIDKKPPVGPNHRVAEGSAGPGTNSVSTGFFEVGPGIFSVVYFNGANDDDDDDDDGGGSGGSGGGVLNTRPVSAGGEGSGTWVFGSSFRDYVVFSDSEKVSLKAVVRQVPGPSDNSFGPWASDNIAWAKNLVLIQSWGEPVDVAPVITDLDGDGILDTVDGTFTGGAFVDQSAEESNNFTDQHRGGVTSGSIVDRTGIDVRVRDLNDPAEGVLIWATGKGQGDARGYDEHLWFHRDANGRRRSQGHLRFHPSGRDHWTGGSDFERIVYRNDTRRRGRSHYRSRNVGVWNREPAREPGKHYSRGRRCRGAGTGRCFSYRAGRLRPTHTRANGNSYPGTRSDAHAHCGSHIGTAANAGAHGCAYCCGHSRTHSRAHGCSHPNANSDSGDAHAGTNSHAYAYGYAHAGADSYPHAHAHAHAYTYTCADSYSHAHACAGAFILVLA